MGHSGHVAAIGRTLRERGLGLQRCRRARGQGESQAGGEGWSGVNMGKEEAQPRDRSSWGLRLGHSGP